MRTKTLSAPRRREAVAGGLPPSAVPPISAGVLPLSALGRGRASHHPKHGLGCGLVVPVDKLTNVFECAQGFTLVVRQLYRNLQGETLQRRIQLFAHLSPGPLGSVLLVIV